MCMRGGDMPAPLVSIIVPHYQTESLARLCLRSIRRYTHPIPYEVIVVDNASGDGASLEYLRQVEWIRLIDRQRGVSRTPSLAHKEAVDIGIAASQAPYVLSFHTDTIPICDGWLDWLLEQMSADEHIAAVGTYKLELPSPIKQALKALEAYFGLSRRQTEGTPQNRPYIRSHCALYRREVLSRLGLRYVDVEHDTAGRTIHFALQRHGYEPRLLPVPEMLKRVVHLNHGTMVMIPQLGARPSTIRRGWRAIDRFLADPAVRAVYHDESLDR